MRTNLTATVYETMSERNPPEVVVLVQEPKKRNPMEIEVWHTEIMISQDPIVDLTKSRNPVLALKQPQTSSPRDHR